MKNKIMKMLGMAYVSGLTAMSYGGEVLAKSKTKSSGSKSDFDVVVNPIIGLLNQFLYPMLFLVSAAGALYCIMLGVKYATAEEPQEREKRKQSLKTAIIGYVLIFVLIVALALSRDPLIKWMESAIAGK